MTREEFIHLKLGDVLVYNPLKPNTAHVSYWVILESTETPDTKRGIKVSNLTSHLTLAYWMYWSNAFLWNSELL